MKKQTIWVQWIMLIMRCAYYFFVFTCVFGILAYCVSQADTVLGKLLVSFIIIACVCLVLLAIHTFSIFRRRLYFSILSYIHQAITLNLPLPRYLESAISSEPVRNVKELLDVHDAVLAGQSPATAIEKYVSGLSLQKKGTLVAAERVGKLRETLTRLIDADKHIPSIRLQSLSYLRVYPICVLSFWILLVSFFNLFILPKFYEIFKDFNTTLPPWTQWFLDTLGKFSNMFSAFPDGGFLLLAVCILLILSLRLVHVRSPFAPSLRNFSVFRRILWYLPVLGKLERNRNYTDLFSALSDALDAGFPLHTALRESLYLHLNPILHKRVQRWLQRMDEGRSFADAAGSAKLPALALGLLSSSFATTLSSDALHFLTDYYRSRYSRLQILLLTFLEPLVILLMALPIAGFIFAIFLPMVKLIDTVSLDKYF